MRRNFRMIIFCFMMLTVLQTAGCSVTPEETEETVSVSVKETKLQVFTEPAVTSAAETETEKTVPETAAAQTETEETAESAQRTESEPPESEPETETAETEPETEAAGDETAVVAVTRNQDGSITGKGTYGYRFNPVDTRDGKVDYWGIDVYDENGKSFYYQIEAVIDADSIYIPEPEELLCERDVNFDGRMDIVVYKGTLGAHGVRYEKAYIRSGDAFEEVIGYDEIPEAMPCPPDSRIYGTIRDGAARYIEVCYEIDGNRAVKLGEIPYEYDEDAEDYVAIN